MRSASSLAASRSSASVNISAPVSEVTLLPPLLTTALTRVLVQTVLVKLNGEVDAIVFTGGMGENDAELRDEVCADLQTFGISVGDTGCS